LKYRRLGNSGLKVSEIGLGANNFGRRVDPDGTAAVIDRALEVGINLIDTANTYGGDRRSEEYIGLALKGRREDALIATKAAMSMGDGPNDKGASRLHLMSELEKSLRCLRTDYVDLYQVHFPDEDTPIEETMQALDDMVRQGKVRYVGCSNFMAWQVCEAIWTSRTYGLAPFVSVQPHYSIMERTIEAELVPFCREYDVGILPYFPLASGFLTGKYRRGQGAPEGTRLAEGDRGMFSDKNFDLLESLEAFASDRGHGVLEIAFAWLLANPNVSSVIAGATRTDQVESNANASDWAMTPEEKAEVDALLDA
jgi:aryl-alcohol dehydrogenase-like predicted oxidoreductase